MLVGMCCIAAMGKMMGDISMKPEHELGYN